MGSTPRNISASRGAAVLGLSQFQTRLEVWQRIMEERQPGFNLAHGFVLPEDPDNASIRWGLAFESAICELAGNITNRELECSCEGGIITCHLDGQYPDGTNHEGKTTTSWTFREEWGEAGSDRVPQIYQVQAQHQMMCSGAPETVLSVLVFPKRPEEWEEEGWAIENELWITKGIGQHVYLPDWARALSQMGFFHQYRIKADPELQHLLRAAYLEFWNDHVLTGIPPAPRNYDDILRLVPAPCGTIIADEQTARWCIEYADITAEVGQMGKRKDELKTLILDAARLSGKAEDPESAAKYIIRNDSGRPLATFDGKTFRAKRPK